MLELLAQVETELPTLIRKPTLWNGVDIDYHPPRVERLWMQFGEYRLYLHRLHPCSAADALFHPHPWPSVIHMLSGTYEMAVGYGAGDTAPPYAAKMISRGDLQYEMTDPDAWHYVRPVGGVCYSIMISGPQWNRWAPKSDKPLSPLSEKSREQIFSFFANRFPG